MVSTTPFREYRGLSTDEKPVDDSIENGAAFVEMDTGNVFLFDAKHKIWYPL